MVTAIPPVIIQAADDKALQAERREAQKQRQQQKNERAKLNREALQDFREFANEIKKDYTEKARALDTEYRLQKADLNAKRQMKIAEVDAELQKNMTGLFLNPESGEQASVEKLKADMKAYSDKAFAIKQQAALEEHEEFIRNEFRKHELLSERDARALAKARELGLLDKPAPILAKPIGGELTHNEERWNEREQKDVQRMFDSNQGYIAEFKHGKELRAWEIENKREDFRLKAEKARELHALNSEQTWINSLMFSPQGDAQTDAARRQEFTDKLAEISRKTQEINIKYNKLNKQNNIKRSEERRKIMGR
jgi:hypothetical protein